MYVVRPTVRKLKFTLNFILFYLVFIYCVLTIVILETNVRCKTFIKQVDRSLWCTTSV